MEVFFIVLFIIIVIYSLRDEYLKKKNKEQKNYTDNFSMDSREYYKKLRENAITKELKVDKLIDAEIVEDSKEEFNTTINVYVQQNNFYESNDKKNKGDHSEKVSNYTTSLLQLESGLTKNQKKVKQLGYSLVNKYGSKRKAKDILVKEYKFDEKTAKYATGYKGYENW